MIIRPEKLTQKTFLPYGEVLQTDGVEPELINFGNTQKFSNLAQISLVDGGHGQLSIYRSRAIELPFRIRLMERHNKGSQAFFPLHQRPFPVIVSDAKMEPGLADIRVFLTNGKQGVNIHPGIWHHYQLTLGEASEYVVVDRRGERKDCEEYSLPGDLDLYL